MSVADGLLLTETQDAAFCYNRISIVTVGALSLSVIVPVAVSVVDPLFPVVLVIPTVKVSVDSAIGSSVATVVVAVVAPAKNVTYHWCSVTPLAVLTLVKPKVTVMSVADGLLKLWETQDAAFCYNRIPIVTLVHCHCLYCLPYRLWTLLFPVLVDSYREGFVDSAIGPLLLLALLLPW
jgi:hypothetical protein